MISIRALGTPNTLRLPVEITRWQTTLQSVPKGFSLSGMAEQHQNAQIKMNVFQAMGNALSGGGGFAFGPHYSLEAKSGVAEALMASVRLPVIRLGFVSSFQHPSRELLSALEKWVRPVSTGAQYTDALTAPVCIWTEMGPDKLKSLVGVGILQSLQYGWQPRGRSEASVFQGELALMDCRLDTDFIKKCHGQDLMGGG